MRTLCGRKRGITPARFRARRRPHWDYNQYGLLPHGEEATEGTPPVLIAWDDGHRALWALPVDHKGAEEYVVNWLVRKIDEAGYSGVPLTIKTDQEPAIVALKRAVAIRRQAETTPIESPVRE